MRFWNQWGQFIDYKIFLPLISRLPLSLGQRLAQIRGWFHGLIDYDWRSQALRQHYVRKATLQTMQALLPQENYQKHLLKTLHRFVHHSREEWESCIFHQQKLMTSIYKNSLIEGVQPLIQAQQQNQSLILLTCHLDSFCMGIVLLGICGLRLHAITTAALEDPRISPAVQQFFQNKITGMEMYMRGGRFKYYETHLNFFYQILTKGETVVIQADLPAAPHVDAITVSFLGCKRRMSAGTRRIALKTNSLVAAYVCIHQGIGKYQVICTSPQPINTSEPEQTLQPLYQFLETYIRQYPDRWLAADLFPIYDNIL